MSRRKIGNHVWKCFCTLSMFFLFCASAYAVPLTVELSASTLGIPTSGMVILDFIDGDGLTGSRASVYNLASSPSNLSGSVSQTAPGRYLFTDNDFISSLYFDIANVYSGFSFTVDANMVDPGSVGFPDSFVFSLTDVNGIPLFATSDPRGTNSLLVLSTYGNEVYAPDGFNITIANDSNPVPEPGTILLLVAGLPVLVFTRKRFRAGIMILFFALLLSFIGTPAYAALMDVTSQVSVQRAPLVFNRATSTFDGLVTIRNNGTNTLKSPMFLVVAGIPDTVSVNNATSISTDGFPMLNLPVTASGLASSQSISNFRIKFHNPNNLKFTAVFRVLSDSGELPPDPGEAGKSTLNGVDTNNNGIRDDIEIYIAVNFGSSQKSKEGLNQLATTLQQGIVATSEQGSVLAANNFSKAMECLKYVSPNSQSWKSVQSMSVNTPERFSAWLAHEKRLSGKIFPARPMSEWKNSCNFNPDNLGN